MAKANHNGGFKKVPQRGFSLVEIAVVLVIVGLALGTGLAILQAKVAQTRIDTTKERAEVIRKALIAYVSQNNRLPCPAAPGLVSGVAGYNVEQVTGGPGAQVCTNGNGLVNNVGGAVPAGASRGTVPCITLGIPESACTDTWDTRFTYFVSNSAVRLTANTVSGLRGNMTLHKVVPPAAATLTNGLAPTGNQINACSTTANDNSCNLAAAVMIVSHGANRAGGFAATSNTAVPTAGTASAYEILNTDNNLAFIQNDYVESGTNSFDDIVVAVPPNDLIFNLTQSGALQSTNALMSARLEAIKRAIIQNIYPAATGSSPNKQITLPAETGAAAAYTFPGTVSFTGCVPVPTTTQVLPTAVTVPALNGLLNDIWQFPIRYRRAVTAAFGATSACATPFVLISYGPDGVAGGNDDIVYPVTQADLTLEVTKLGGW